MHCPVFPYVHNALLRSMQYLLLYSICCGAAFPCSRTPYNPQGKPKSSHQFVRESTNNTLLQIQSSKNEDMSTSAAMTSSKITVKPTSRRPMHAYRQFTLINHHALPCSLHRQRLLHLRSNQAPTLIYASLMMAMTISRFRDGNNGDRLLPQRGGSGTSVPPDVRPNCRPQR